MLVDIIYINTHNNKINRELEKELDIASIPNISPIRAASPQSPNQNEAKILLVLPIFY